MIPMPADANANHDIFGSWIMSQVDLAGSIPAVRRAKGRNCHGGGEPVHLQTASADWRRGEFYASVKRVGRTSVTVDVEVFPSAIAAPRW